MSVIGIDFGSSNCTIAAAQKGGIDILTNEVSSRQTPCMVGFGDKQRWVGESALTQYARNPGNTITDAKRLLGYKWNDPTLQQEIKGLPYKVVELPNQEVGIQVMYGGEKKVFTPVVITAMILAKLKEISEKALQKSVKDVVISVPGYWGDAQRRAFFDATKIAGLNALRLINDNTATALQYGIYKTTLSDKDATRVMLIDMGSTSTAVSIVDFFKGQLKIVTSVYDKNLGGRNFDSVIVDHFAQEFKEKYKIDIASNPRALVRLQIACEKLKKMLNTVPEAPINVDSIMNDIDVKGLMKRADLEKLFQPLLTQLEGPIKQALEEAQITADKLAAVEITGGGTRLSSVQNKIQEYLKRDVSKTINSEESVSRGCAWQCAILSPLFKLGREYTISDVSLFPIKVNWKNISPDSMNIEEDSAEVFSKNNVLPNLKMVTFHRNQPFEIVAEYSDKNLTPSAGSPWIGTFTVAHVPSFVSKEVPKIRAKVKLNLHGITAVESIQLVETLEELETAPAAAAEGEAPKAESPKSEEASKENAEAKTVEDSKEDEKSKKKKVKRTDLAWTEKTASLPEKDIQLFTEEEQKMQATDRLILETSEKKNAVESFVYSMRGKLSETLVEFAPESDRENLSKLLDDTENWLYGDGEDVTKSVYVKKLDELKAIGDPIEKRKYEYDNRYDSLNAIRSSIEQFKMTASSIDPKYDHIEQEERNKVTQECANVDKWLTEKFSKQDQLPKHVDPVITVVELNKKKTELDRFCTAIFNKPKPKPAPKPEEPKKEEPKKEEPKKEEQKEEKKPEPEQKKDDAKEMDLD